MNPLFRSSYHLIFLCLTQMSQMTCSLPQLLSLTQCCLLGNAAFFKEVLNIYRRNLLLYLHYFAKMILSKVTSQSPNPLGIWICLFFWTFFHLMLFLKTFCAQHFLYLASVTLPFFSSHNFLLLLYFYWGFSYSHLLFKCFSEFPFNLLFLFYTHVLKCVPWINGISINWKLVRNSVLWHLPTE